MITAIDNVLDRITMYRLVVYVLLAQVGFAAVLAFWGVIGYSPLDIVISAAFLVVMCWATNNLLAWAFNVPTNVESAAITGLILALIVTPAAAPSGYLLLGWAAILAMASKYILAWNHKHIFNPAVIAVIITGYVLKSPASWWVATADMLPVTIIGGYLIVRKLRQEAVVGLFVGASIVTVCAVSLAEHLAIPHELNLLLVASPVFFIGSIMLTEPLTAPPTRQLKLIYAALVGILVVPQIHAGSLYTTPELALVVGNVYAFLVGPKYKIVMRLKRKTRVAPDILDFTLLPSRPLAFEPGQYIECTLDHPRADDRGNRRFFTLASSPTEDVVHLGVRFYKQGSTYKRAMSTMDQRSQLYGAQIAGDFTLPRDPKRKLVFIAGGIGITPYRSMLKYLVDTKQRRDVILIYINKSPQDIIYRDVLEAAQSRVGVKTLYALTEEQSIPHNWTGHRGRVTAETLLQIVPDHQERIFYLSGPPDLVRAYDHMLHEAGVHERQIKKDFFPGLV
jgi:ferredoxin-NADP reductase/Na+-translocating ferredoxin:NAD+ oxidoreductase RnfD subunit